jgi:hypothetical protein
MTNIGSDLLAIRRNQLVVFDRFRGAPFGLSDRIRIRMLRLSGAIESDVERTGESSIGGCHFRLDATPASVKLPESGASAGAACLMRYLFNSVLDFFRKVFDDSSRVFPPSPNPFHPPPGWKESQPPHLAACFKF